MKKALLFASSAVLAFTTSIASATVASSGIIIGAQLGYATASTPNTNAFNAALGMPFFTSSSDKNFAWGIFGGYNFALTPNLLIGPQIGYNSYSSTRYNSIINVSVDTSAIDLLAVGTYVFDMGLNIFAKAGVAREQETGSVYGIGYSNTAYHPEIALGTGYLWNNFNFNIEYKHIFADDQTNNLANTDNTVPTVNAIFAGVTYQLPF